MSNLFGSSSSFNTTMLGTFGTGKIQPIGSNTTWTIPAGITSVRVRVWGAGAGASNSSGSYYGGGGGAWLGGGGGSSFSIGSIGVNAQGNGSGHGFLQISIPSKYWLISL